ncbi:MAG: 50S ribosomal protein L23 [Candidatus Margulisiibacteriota bacterium]
MKNPAQVLFGHLVTEKGSRSRENNYYVFRVAPEANKIEVRQAVEKTFNVLVVSVNTVNCSGKKRVMRGKIGHTSRFKKAYVKLKAGQKIEKIDAAV